MLLGALGAALLIAITLVALFGGFSGGGDDAGSAEPIGSEVTTTTTTSGTRPVLTITLTGDGDGGVTITPGNISCEESCEHRFKTGTRVTVEADPESNATFEGWGDDCDGEEQCAISMNGERSITALFASRPVEPTEPADPVCDDPIASAEDPACADEPLDEELDPPADDPAPTTPSDCNDGRDNDRDGLTDAAQDPNCEGGGNEAGSTPSPGATTTPRTPRPPPPPPPPANECADGRDNDGDGLTDSAQDPNCVTGRTESG